MWGWWWSWRKWRLGLLERFGPHVGSHGGVGEVVVVVGEGFGRVEGEEEAGGEDGERPGEEVGGVGVILAINLVGSEGSLGGTRGSVGVEGVQVAEGPLGSLSDGDGGAVGLVARLELGDVGGHGDGGGLGSVGVGRGVAGVGVFGVGLRGRRGLLPRRFWVGELLEEVVGERPEGRLVFLLDLGDWEGGDDGSAGGPRADGLLLLGSLSHGAP
mmetsp:Transcript_17271/g.53956  ORF Transcript_17271/g.53956 Transcript_17271/m.53956 type:complete len:214 (+) Transcript_17271:122-763(+)